MWALLEVAVMERALRLYHFKKWTHSFLCAILFPFLLRTFTFMNIKVDVDSKPFVKPAVALV